MSEAKITLHVETLTDSSYVPSFTARISVKSAEGITPCIFVHQYVPKLPCADATYEFMNVAYYDELNSVPDYLKSQREPGLVRKSSVEKGLPSQEELEDFIATVEHDVKRLIAQVNTTTVSGLCRDVEITAETITQTVSEDCENSTEELDTGGSDLAPGVVTLTFAGTTIAEIN